ncbi:pentapeptide repeat-containing protein [Leptothoe sp. LEGE 181152]|nr:pentapeptide repeat-containing protein [Leptothoe sp. LEGE 181152]
MRSNTRFFQKNTEKSKLYGRKKKKTYAISFKRLFSPKILALGISLLFVGTLPLWEKIPLDEGQIDNTENQAKQTLPQQFKCEHGESGINYFICKLKESRVLAPVQNIGVVIAATLYVLETSQRRKQQHRQAWQVIDSARDVETSGARIHALEELVEDGESLCGLDADGADLRNIRLSGADLSDASLTMANLKHADLRLTTLERATLNGADLCGSNLEGANLKRAQLNNINRHKLEGDPLPPKQRAVNLKETDLGASSLQGADLEYAILEGANLSASKLQYASFRSAKLDGVDFQGADLEGARFANAKGLSIEQLKKQQAKNWKQAYYDRIICQTHPNENLLEDDVNDETWKLKQTTKYSKKDENPVELELLSCIQHMLSLKEKIRHQEIQNIRSKIAELRVLLNKTEEEIEKGSEQANELANEVVVAVQSLSESEEDPAQVVAVQDDIIQIPQLMERLDYLDGGIKRINEDEERESDIRPFHEAGQWIISNVELISCRTSDEYIKGIKQPLYDAREFYNGVSDCLSKLGNHLNNVHLLDKIKPSYADFSNSLPASVNLEALHIILGIVIPEFFLEKPSKISEDACKVLEWILGEAIKAIDT